MKRTKTIIGLVAAACLLVAIFTLFADAFAGTKDFPSSRGTAYQVMFGNQGYDAVPGMIVAWVVLLVAELVVLIGSFIPAKLGGIVLAFGSILGIGASVAFFFAPGMFSAVANVAFVEEAPALGVGLILTAIFGIVGGLIGLFGARNAMKE